jgi:hypothetical protein
MNNVSFTFEDDLSVPQLSDGEKKWIKRLQKVLGECPPRLELVTIGDPELDIVDKEGALKSVIADGAAAEDGIVLASIKGGPTVHGVSG